MLKVELADGNGGRRAEVVTDDINRTGKESDINGLMAFTAPFETYRSNPLVAVNQTFGSSMNQNAGFGGTPDGIYNGGDSTLWTPSTLQGNAGDFIEESTDQANSGTNSLDATPSENNDQLLLTRSSTITFADYTAITGFVYLTGWDSPNQNIGLRFRLAGTDIGTELNLSTYIDETVFNTWIKFAIPLTDFGLSGTTLDEFVIKTIDTGSGDPPNYYLDDIQLEQTGDPLTYTIQPPTGEVADVFGFRFIIVDNFDAIQTVAGATENATLPSLSYNKFGNLTELANGLIARRIINEIVEFNATLKNNFDILALPTTRIELGISDGTNTMVIFDLTFSTPIRLDSSRNDRFELIVSDDLSAMTQFQIRAKARLVRFARKH